MYKRTFRYHIDSEERLTCANDEWLAFAVENNSSHLTRKSVLERPLWDFITGMETRHLYRLIFSKVKKTGMPVKIPYRCDSPELRRFMEMEIVPVKDGSVQMNCTLLRVEPRPRMDLLDPFMDRSNEFLTICSWCRRVKIGSGWVEVEEAVQRLNLFEAQRLPQLTHGICPDCHEIAMREFRMRRKEAIS